MSSVYQQSQRDQSYTMSSQDQWLTSVPQLSSPIEPSNSFDPHHLEPAEFADSLCNTMGLSPKYRSDLHAFLAMLPGPRHETIPMLYIMANSFYTQQLVLAQNTNFAAIADILQEVKAALAQNLDFTKEQTLEITTACKLTVFDPKRVDYDNDSVRREVLTYLKAHQSSNGLKSVFDTKSPARLRALNQLIGLQTSYAKSIFRTHIQKSLTGCATLATTTAMRKLVGSCENITPVHAMRMLILRQFARDNPELFKDSRKHARVERDDDDAEADNSKTSCVNEYWPQFTKFVEGKNEEWTDDLRSPGWTQYINVIIAHEKRLFGNDMMPLIPTVDVAAFPRAPSTEERPMRPLPTRTGASAKQFQLPPLRISENTPANGMSFLLPFTSYL
ncbi:hypothetical protein C8R46DRAFT_1213112 [Mycena filopes]|nr:hypothetical protein C8R46DRAFT_1213112 [Mycena filopes]